MGKEHLTRKQLVDQCTLNDDHIKNVTHSLLLSLAMATCTCGYVIPPLEAHVHSEECKYLKALKMFNNEANGITDGKV